MSIKELKMKKIQSGKISKLLIALIAIGTIFGLFYAYKQKNQIINQVSSITNRVTETIISEPSYTGYGVQLMASWELKQAEQLMNDFARDGYSAFVLRGQMRGRSIYKVRIGPYAYRSEALAIKDKLKRRYPKNRYVKSSIVIFLP